MKRLTLFSCVLVMIQLFFSSAVYAKKKVILKNMYLRLYQGEVRVLKIGNVERVAVGNGKLLSTSITKTGQLIILAEKKGETLIHVWGKAGWERDVKIQVSELNPRSAIREIKSLLRNTQGLSIRLVGGRVVIEGDVGPDIVAKVVEIKKYYPNILVLINEKTASFHDKMIHMKVQITEFSSNALEEVGINWNASFPGPYVGAVAAPNSAYISPISGEFVPPEAATPPVNPLAGTKAFGFFGIMTALNSRINLMQSSGDALILASPTLIARSGGQAEFLAGGEIPLPSTSVSGTTVEFKSYGIGFNIKPFADKDKNITARVDVELSAPDLSITVNGIPGFLTRKSSADLSMKDGETMVIAGLMNSDLSKNKSEVKYLASIPILGALFRNKSLRDKKTELVIFVTAKVIDAQSNVNKEGIKQRKMLIKRFSEAVELEDWIDEDSPNVEVLKIIKEDEAESKEAGEVTESNAETEAVSSGDLSANTSK